METNIPSPLCNYFWREVDTEKAESDQEIRTLKMLASIGYNSALDKVRGYMSDSVTNAVEKHEGSDISRFDIDLEPPPGLAASVLENPPSVYDSEVDSEGLLDLKLPYDYEEKLVGLSSDEEDDSTSMEDMTCSAYIYGGPEVENTEGWERLGLLPDPWAEARHPTLEILTSEDLTADEIEPNLNTLTITSGMGNLALTPDFKGYGYTKLQLPSKGITGVELLQYYPYLQYVDLANNKIEDPSPLWKIKHLVVLDLSNNYLTDASIDVSDQVGFLTYLNLSRNKFTKVPDFSKCWAIKHFDVAHNQIQWIENLSELKYLSYLNLSHNQLEFVENLDNKLLTEVDFSYNIISRWQNPCPKESRSMENINISHNRITTLAIFSEMYNLTTFDVSYNMIRAMTEFDVLKTLPSVTNLKISGNNLNTIIPDPRRLIIYLLPSIQILDGVPISPMERVSSVSLFASNPMQQMVWHSMRSLYYFCSRRPTVGWERPKMTGDHPALVILVGDIGSSRKIIINMVQRMNPYICKEVKMTTSRPRVKGEVTNSRMHYISLKKFNTIEKEGGFLVVERRLGHKYGIAVSELEDKNRVLLLFLGMTAALEVVWKGFNPTLILILPNEEAVLKERCLQWFLSSDVYRTIFKVRKVPKCEKKEEVEQGNNKGEDDGDDDEDSITRQALVNIKNNPILSIERLAHKYTDIYSHYRDRNTHRPSPYLFFGYFNYSSTERKSSEIETKFVKLTKCRSMFTSSGKKKWMIKKETENLGLNRKILEECYGKYFSGTTTTTRDTWFESRTPSVHVSFTKHTEKKPSREGNLSERGSQIKRSEEKELRRFVLNIFLNQMNYRTMHIQNPGLFRLFISSDDYEKAAHALLGVVESLYIKLEDSKKIKTVNMQSDPNYKSMVEEPLMELINEVTAHDQPLDIAI